MTSHVHEFDPREGGSFRISLTYDAPGSTGKSAPHTDTYHGHFARLVPDEHISAAASRVPRDRVDLAPTFRG